MKNDVRTAVIVGQGYVGLPVAMRAVERGYRVVGLDLDARRVALLKSGSSFVDDVSHETLESALTSGNYMASDDYADAEGFDIAVITVPTPLREGVPELSFIESSAASLAPYLTAGALVILESTTYPGTTEELLVPILESGSGLVAGVDFHVGYSPERIDPGNSTWTFVTTPKVVSGINEESLGRVREFYSDLVDRVVEVSSPKEAELTKLLENTFRHVNIALVNELATFAHELGVDIWEAIDAASTKPFGFMRFVPGPGVGGHCLPIDPSYLAWQVRRKLGQNFRFVELANDVNEHMPDYVMQRLLYLLNTRGLPAKGSRIALVGLAYKKNTGDIREAPSLRFIQILRDYGATILGVDEHVEAHAWPDGVEAVSLTDEMLASVDAAVLLTDHDGFDYGILENSQTPILDTRNRLRGELVDRL